ncbi:unnamed protein product [Protopolystoma xenopodis]|uniref:Uncharacterized protein n=1 Tax=Protopolystoma xenopodis TaxID=117903 RepID=A0A3S5AR26_9PLAT|nr:unnamed protein product [Protopolystoma xenopodis]
MWQHESKSREADGSSALIGGTPVVSSRYWIQRLTNRLVSQASHSLAQSEQGKNPPISLPTFLISGPIFAALAGSTPSRPTYRHRRMSAHTHRHSLYLSVCLSGWLADWLVHKGTDAETQTGTGRLSRLLR